MVKILTIVAKAYGVLWCLDNAVIAKGIALGHYADMLEEHYKLYGVSQTSAKTVFGTAFDSLSDCYEAGIDGWKKFWKFIKKDVEDFEDMKEV